MRSINPYSHFGFLHPALMNFFEKESIESRVRRSVGAIMDSLFDSEEYFDQNRMRAIYPAQSLFYWLSSGERVDAEWLTSEGGEIYDDYGVKIDVAAFKQLSAAQHMAAYGLWLLGEDISSCGPSAEEDWDDNRINPQGWKELEVIDHRGECLLIAYQALAYSQRLNTGEKLNDEESKNISAFNFSEIGKNGAKKRHASMNKLRDWAVVKYRAGTWPSANQAAHELKDSVIQHGRTIGANLEPQNAQRTIANWFRRSA